jgi:hypothetical protein
MDEVVIPKPGGLIVIDRGTVAEPDALSVTFTVKVLDPVVLGVPDSMPSAERLRPAGSVPVATDHEYGGVPPEAAKACE